MSEIIGIGVNFQEHHTSNDVPVAEQENVIDVGVIDEVIQRQLDDQTDGELGMTADDLKTALTTSYSDRVVAGDPDAGNSLTLNDIREKWAAKAGLQHEPLVPQREIKPKLSAVEKPRKLRDGDLVGYHGAIAFVHDAASGGQRNVPLDTISESQLDNFENNRSSVELAF